MHSVDPHEKIACFYVIAALNTLKASLLLQKGILPPSSKRLPLLA